MIQQHYYTREKKGLYSATPGYDTIAKSKKLEDTLIKGVLHNYCFYEAPFELIQEEDFNKYPKALMCFNIPSKEMIIGCSSFAGKDYTGERNRYFTHNYVVSATQKEVYIRNPERIFHAEFKVLNLNYSLLDSYSHDFNGTILEELTDIPMDKYSVELSRRDQLFKKLCIDSSMYKKLLSACFDSVINNRKIYILLNVHAEELSKYSKQLMEYIYIGLPYVIRGNFGFITYVKDSKSKEYINLQFVAKGGIKKAEVEQSFAYVFDFQEKSHINITKLEKKSAYLDFVWDNLDNPHALNAVFNKADSYSKDNSQWQGASLEDYNEIIITNFKNTLESEVRKFERNNIGEIENQILHRDEAQSQEFKDKEIDANILQEIDISHISKRQIKSFVMEEKYKNNDTYMIVYYLQRILISSVEREISLSERKICELSLKMTTENCELPSMLLKVKTRIQYFYDKEVSKETFRKITMGFIECNFHNTFDYTYEKKDAFSEGLHINYNFQQLFNYLFSHGGIDKVRDYILWAINDFSKLKESEVSFVFFQALGSYIENNDNDFFKDKNFRRKLFQSDNDNIVDRVKVLEIDMCQGIRKFILGLRHLRKNN